MAFFKYGELPLVLLALLDARSMNGYELLAAISERFEPHYVPSPGSVYPAISALEREQLITGEATRRQKVYSLTDAGRTALDTRVDYLARIEQRTGVRLRGDSSVTDELAVLRTTVEQAVRTVASAALTKVLADTTSKIRTLIEKSEPKP